MKTTKVKVALNMSRLSVPEKINKARNVHDAINANASVFSNPSPALSVVDAAINDLESAWNKAQDGGKSLKAIMRDKEQTLMKHMNDLAGYVEKECNNDAEIVHLAKLDVKKPASVNRPEFEVYQLDHAGAVGLRVKPRGKTMYKWQYCADPLATNTWITAKTTTMASAEIENLTVGELYWFRVVFIGLNGETPNTAVSFAVN